MTCGYLNLKCFCSFIQRKRVHFEDEEEKGGNIEGTDVQEEKEKLNEDKEENVIAGRKVTISFLFHFLRIILCNIIMQN